MFLINYRRKHFNEFPCKIRNQLTSYSLIDVSNNFKRIYTKRQTLRHLVGFRDGIEFLCNHFNILLIVSVSCEK